MSVNLTLCGQLCQDMHYSKRDNKDKRGKRNRSKNSNVEHILTDINILLADANFDKNYICNHILNKLVQIHLDY